jgi:hypothetical protein
MQVLQHYYTSYNNEEAGRIGFQVKGMSPGITPQLEATIAPLIAYRIPPSLEERSIDTHPIALRYYYKGPEECILVCSQSSGNDLNGRPGNFFAHTLVLEPAAFTIVPPIFYWKSSFWRKEDTEPRSRIDSLPILPSFDEEPTFDIEVIWDFLAHGERRAQLYKLMCAVVHSQKTYRRVVIFDTTEHVVMWIAAVTTLLPPDYRPLLSFATYHHDPYQGQYLITGTTSDSLFRASAGDYRSYFVLNVETGETSEVEDSPYAQVAAQAAQPDLYETQLLPLFTDYAPRFPTPTCIDEQLDLIALYARLQAARIEPTLSSMEMEAIRIALSSFEQLREYSQKDIDELLRLQQVLSQAAAVQRNATIARELERISVLLKRHKGQNEEAVENDLKQFIQYIVQQDGSELAARLNQLQQNYNQETLFAQINRPEYLQWMTSILEKASLRQLRLAWQSVGKYIQPERQSQSLLTISLQAAATLWSERRIDEEKTLLEAMWQAMKGNEQAWLQLAAGSQVYLPQGILEVFYYSFVYSLDLDQRVPYRDIVSAASNPGIFLIYEIVSDVHSAAVAGAERGLAEVERWIQHAQQWRYDTTPLVVRGLDQLQRDCSPQELRELAPRILRNRLLVPLPEKLEAQLVDMTLSTFSPGQLSLADSGLYERYQNHAALPKEVQTTLADIVALIKGRLNAMQAKRLHEQVKMLLPEEYQAVVKQCIPRFFRNTVTNDAHPYLIAALFTRNHSYATCFWQSYWETFIGMLMDPSTAGQAAEVLEFWFTVSPKLFQQSYVVQEFFLMLPSTLESIQKNRDFQGAIREFNKVASQQPWYPAVQDFFVEKKSLTGAFVQSAKGALIQLVTGNRKAAKEEEEEAKKQEFAEVVAGLFEKKKAQEQHKQLSKLYNKHPHEEFWSCYWQNFKGIMTSGDVEPGLALLSFWFDQSFETLSRVPYAPQEFFLGLSTALEEVHGEHGFRETARKIHEKASQQLREGYRWYPLVMDYFTREKKSDK